MFVSEDLQVNAQGHLTIGGQDTVELAKQYGTPLYVMDEDLIRKHCRSFKQSIDKFYQGKGLACYASKAFSCKAIYRVMQEEGMGVDVVSGGELYTAMQTGFDSSKICFHGNNKTTEELQMALDYQVGRIIVDNIYELHQLEQMCQEQGKTARIMFRIKPGVDAHTHNFIRTGQIDSKFGFALETGEAMEAVKEALQCKSLHLCGLHCHIGSQILDTNGFEAAAEVMMQFIATIQKELHVTIEELNLGGGFGICYTEQDDPIPYEQYMEAVSKVIRTETKFRESKCPQDRSVRASRFPWEWRWLAKWTKRPARNRAECMCSSETASFRKGSCGKPQWRRLITSWTIFARS